MVLKPECLTLGEPHTASLGDEFLRLEQNLVKGVARSFYCHQIGKRILILVTAIKKQTT